MILEKYCFEITASGSQRSDPPPGTVCVHLFATRPAARSNPMPTCSTAQQEKAGADHPGSVPGALEPVHSPE